MANDGSGLPIAAIVQLPCPSPQRPAYTSAVLRDAVLGEGSRGLLYSGSEVTQDLRDARDDSKSCNIQTPV